MKANLNYWLSMGMLVFGLLYQVSDQDTKAARAYALAAWMMAAATYADTRKKYE